MKFNDCIMTPTNSAVDLPSTKSQLLSQSTEKRASQSSLRSRSSQEISNQRRRSLSALNNHRARTPQLSSPFSVPLLFETISEFFRTTQEMEDEIMLPTRLKDMSIDELIFDNSIQPDNWHELYTFVRDMRNQLQCICPFAGEENVNDDDSNQLQRKYSNDDEGITVADYSSSSSVASSEEFERSSTCSAAPPSFDSIKDELKCHYYGLFQSLSNLTSMANRVRDKYRDETSL